METCDFLEAVDDNFLCSICHCVMLDPHACSQGHQFCRHCILQWLERSDTCPSRCGTLELGNLAKLRSVANMINKLRVCCRHANAKDGASPGPKNVRQRLRAGAGPAGGNPDMDTGCTWVGVLEDRDSHEREECGYTEVACTFDGCSVKVQRLQLTAHEGACEHREVTCEKCYATTKAGALDAHLLFCKMVEVECPEKCGAMVIRGKLRMHEEECGNVVVRCSFAQHGCEVRAKRRKIGEHEAEAVMAHCKLAAGRAERLEEEKKVEAGRAERLEKEKEELEQRFKRLEEQLLQAPKPPGSACVTWRIKNFPKRAIKKKDFKSRVFHVATHGGVYHLYLYADLTRKAGSTRAGYVAFGIAHDTHDGGCINFPVDLQGSEIAAERKGHVETLIAYDDENELLEFGKGQGVIGLKAGKIPGLKWTENDSEAELTEGIEDSMYEVMDFLEDGVLTITASVQLKPPKTIAI